MKTNVNHYFCEYQKGQEKAKIPCPGLYRDRGKRVMLLGAEDAVAGIAQAGDDVAVVIVCNTNINDLGDNHRNQKVKYDFQQFE